MGAFVEFEFKKGFIIDEERFRKLHDILSKRLGEINGELFPIYTIYRADYFTYETNNIEDLISEENCKRSKIKKIVIKVFEEGNIYLSMTFNDEKKSLLLIEGENRDIVYLLASDVKDFLKSDVYTVFNIKNKITWFYRTISMGCLGITTLYMFILTSRLSRLNIVPNAESILANGTIEDKLNYLIMSELNSSISSIGRINSFTPTITFLLGISIATMMLSTFRNNIVNRVINYFFPSYLFLIGDEVRRYKTMKDLRSKIFWTILIGILVSIIAGVIVMRI